MVQMLYKYDTLRNVLRSENINIRPPTCWIEAFSRRCWCYCIIQNSCLATVI